MAPISTHPALADGLDLSGRVALVTGGARGIGRGIAERFLEAGAEVAICGRNEPESLPSFDGREAAFFSADVRDAEQVDAMVAAVVERFGRLDAVVNNAGGAPPADAATASPRFSTSIVALNLLSNLHVAQAANRVMSEQDEGGAIVNVASVSGMRPSPGTAAYGAAKAGLIGLTQSLAVEWAPHVRVNTVSGGIIKTEQADLHYGDAEAIARIEETIPLGRMGEPLDIADACVFLCSPLARWISGSNLVVHGGGEPPAFLGAVEG
jgi:NAD(P)-dependent dehydrogenase (short-subunit alcohol dehydrogenase family)